MGATEGKVVVLALDEILRLTFGFHATCTVANPKDQCTTYAVDLEHLELLRNGHQQLFVLVDPSLQDRDWPELEGAKRVRRVPCFDVERTFVLFHNEVNRHRSPVPCQYGPGVVVHPTAQVGIEGARWVKAPEGPVRMKHMGGVICDEGVEVGPFSTVVRGTIDDTVIGKNVKIGNHCNVGHNCQIGEGTMLAENVHIGGTAEIGERCWFGIGACVRPHVKIVDDVRIGMGGMVVEDIEEPGTYFGVPAKRVGGYDGEW